MLIRLTVIIVPLCLICLAPITLAQAEQATEATVTQPLGQPRLEDDTFGPANLHEQYSQIWSTQAGTETLDLKFDCDSIENPLDNCNTGSLLVSSMEPFEGEEFSNKAEFEITESVPQIEAQLDKRISGTATVGLLLLLLALP